jgi:RND family efflux transporter MFP subunit
MRMQSDTLVASVLLLIGMLFVSCSTNNGTVEIKQDEPINVTMAVAMKQSDNLIDASGKIESKETALISTRVMGVITSIKVKPGDKVQKGQLLVTISSADILAKRSQAQAMVEEAEAALKDAQKDYERFAELYKQNSVSEKEFENVKLNFNSISAKAEAARQVQREADAMLSYTNLTAPFSGVITQRDSDAGSMANPGVPILMMEQSGSYQITASVSETDIANVREGAQALITIKSSGRTFDGRVTEVSPSSQFSGGQYSIKVSIPDRENDGLYSGMYVSVSLQAPGAMPNNMVLVPASAIVSKDQLTGLYTITEDKTAVLRWVRLGKAHGNQVQVLSGLSQDEKYVLESEGRLYNGAPVHVK